MAQKERISAIVSAGNKIHAFDGHRMASFCFVDLDDAATTKLAGVVYGELTDDDLVQMLDQLHQKVGLDRLMMAAGELALKLAMSDQAGGAAH